ncbi:MAG: alpha/beta hydrolase [Candidatus Micrarchaeota archaeon]|nr:alpha/beta hydrolase [Candidatus Micrarchaeota archaeon]
MEQKVFFNSKSGRVCGILKKYSGNVAVIICHGLTSSKDSKTGTALRNTLIDDGITTLSIDLYGHGESEGTMEQLTVSKSVESVVGAYEYLKQNGYDKISLVGSSFSGSVCIVAATLLDLSAMVLKCPVFDYAELLRYRLKEHGVETWKKDGKIEVYQTILGYGIYEDATNLNIKELARKVTCPTLFIHGAGDKMVPPSHSEEAYKMIHSKEKKLYIIRGADHFFIHEKHFNEVIKEAHDWLVKFARG